MKKFQEAEQNKAIENHKEAKKLMDTSPDVV